MMITSLIGLAVLVALLKGLRNGWYILHVGSVLGASWFVQQHYGFVDVDKASLFRFLLIHLCSINIVMFIMYFHDKRRSMRGGWRISEKVMHTYAFIGGSLAALVAQKVFNHKRAKKSFRDMFIFLLFLQVTVAIAAFYFMNKI